MKQLIIMMALLLTAGSVMGQDDKAAAKAAAAELKAKEKQAKAEVAEAQKIKDAIYAKIQEKTAPDPEIITECKKGQKLVQKALKSGALPEKMLGETYKLSSELAVQPHNIQLGYASQKLPMDTAYFTSNLRVLTDALHGELTHTKVTKGETGNEGYLKTRSVLLSQCGDYYIYAAQFEGSCGRYESALKNYDFAMSYKSAYPEVADLVKLRIPDEQIAYYAFHTAHEGKLYDQMDKYYDQAMKFQAGADGTKQVKISSYLERGDSTAWANYVRQMTIENPDSNKDYVQMLISYYLKKGNAEAEKYADDIIAADPNVLIANYGKAYVKFQEEKYDDALTYYKKCTEINPDYYDAWYQCGLCRYRQALAKNATISGIKNQVKAKAELEATKKLFAEAIPFFEKARECAPDEPQKWAYELKQCYTVTGQSAKATAMDKLL